MSLPNSRKPHTQRSKQQLNAPTHLLTGQHEWIGQDLLTPPSTPAQPERRSQPPHSHEPKSNESKGLSVGNKSPVELMQDILRMVGDGQENWVYYSKEAEESLGELLTNRFKLTSYIKKLESEMVGLDSSVVKNYEILVLLLGQLSGADVEVRQGQEGMEVRFNRSLIERQEAEIERLEREKEDREKQIKFIIEQY
jgi:hypothetical protein